MRKQICTAATLLALLAVTPAHAQSTEERLDRLERRLESSALLELSNQNERLRREIQQLTGRIDELEREIEATRGQQRSLYQDLDQRLQALGGEGAEAPAEPIAEADPETPALAETPALDEALADEEAATADEDEERDPVAEAEDMLDRAEAEEQRAETPRRESGSDAGEAYREAFTLLRDGRYGAAGGAFRAVIEDHPDTTEADNARYWLAESYYVTRNFEEAMEHFTAVADDGNNNKQPDAMLKIGYIHYEQGNFSEAREVLETVRDNYSGTTVATLAGNRLNRMRDEGR